MATSLQPLSLSLMEPHQIQHEEQTHPERKGQKWKLEEDVQYRIDPSPLSSPDAHKALIAKVSTQVTILNNTFSWKEFDRSAAKHTTHVLAEIVKNEDVVNVLVDGGVVPALVKHLKTPLVSSGDIVQWPCEHEVEKGSVFALGLLVVKPKHQQLILDAGALPGLVDLLNRHKDGSTCRAVNGVIRRAADAITNLAHENSSIKTLVRVEGGIPLLVKLLEFDDTKV